MFLYFFIPCNTHRVELVTVAKLYLIDNIILKYIIYTMCTRNQNGKEEVLFRPDPA